MPSRSRSIINQFALGLTHGVIAFAGRD